ncbi:hypothetical protein JAAARDRAFT_196093 [Jaapia argillacea MUCL 33604]|uniref:Uncharacterized protein n=1 Tax=Jaapia argillacea MUCL 33604 TaxID=933084 RepID=A0A067PVD5_9AGAM|nr:hypothetical protein JAAARDRAFT_196093 [Jaapia argillacea MUCL 33604]
MDFYKLVCQQLEKIQTEMYKMASRKTLSCTVDCTEDAQDIIQWKECLDHAHKMFQIQLEIGGRLFAINTPQQAMDTQQGVVLPPNLNPVVSQALPPAPAIFFG